MVLGYHLTLCTYGFWLPNDPRGSWSNYVGAGHLLPYGTATKTNVRHSVARTSHDIQRRLLAKNALKYPPITLTGPQAREIGIAFGEYFARDAIMVWACCILPNHVHLAIARSRIRIEEITSQLKSHATKRLTEKRMHPLARSAANNARAQSIWSRKDWKVFLNTPADIQRVIRYVEDNPSKEGKPRQHWPFVSPYPPATDTQVGIPL